MELVEAAQGNALVARQITSQPALHVQNILNYLLDLVLPVPVVAKNVVQDSVPSVIEVIMSALQEHLAFLTAYFLVRPVQTISLLLVLSATRALLSVELLALLIWLAMLIIVVQTVVRAQDMYL